MRRGCCTVIKQIKYAPQALSDLRSIIDYISVELNSPQAAERTVDDILDKIDYLSELPEIGRRLSSRINVKTDYRYLVCGNYNIFYRVENEVVKVIRVLNARRNFMLVLFGEEDQN